MLGPFAKNNKGSRILVPDRGLVRERAGKVTYGTNLKAARKL